MEILLLIGGIVSGILSLFAFFVWFNRANENWFSIYTPIYDSTSAFSIWLKGYMAPGTWHERIVRWLVIGILLAAVSTALIILFCVL